MASYCTNIKRTVPRSKNGTWKIKKKFGVQKKEVLICQNPKMQKKKERSQNEEKLTNLEQIYTYTTRLSTHDI